jgi:hypothetical protein
MTRQLIPAFTEEGLLYRFVLAAMMEMKGVTITFED